MKSKRHTTEQIIGKLRRADIELGKGRKVPDVCKLLSITEQTYYRWRQKFEAPAGRTYAKDALPENKYAPESPVPESLPLPVPVNETSERPVLQTGVVRIECCLR